MGKRHKPEEIIAKLRQVEVMTGQGTSMADAIRSIGVTEVTYYRWRSEYGGMKLDQVKRLKELEVENARLRKAVSDLTLEGPHLTRELALIKVVGKGENRVEALRLADAFRARVVDATTESFVFEMTGAAEKIDAFCALMRPIGLAEVSRTGAVAIARGPRGLS